MQQEKQESMLLGDLLKDAGYKLGEISTIEFAPNSTVVALKDKTEGVFADYYLNKICLYRASQAPYVKFEVTSVNNGLPYEEYYSIANAEEILVVKLTSNKVVTYDGR